MIAQLVYVNLLLERSLIRIFDLLDDTLLRHLFEGGFLYGLPQLIDVAHQPEMNSERQLVGGEDGFDRHLRIPEHDRRDNFPILRDEQRRPDCPRIDPSQPDPGPR